MLCLFHELLFHELFQCLCLIFFQLPLLGYSVAGEENLTSTVSTMAIKITSTLPTLAVKITSTGSNVIGLSTPGGSSAVFSDNAMSVDGDMEFARM